MLSKVSLWNPLMKLSQKGDYEIKKRSSVNMMSSLINPSMAVGLRILTADHEASSQRDSNIVTNSDLKLIKPVLCSSSSSSSSSSLDSCFLKSCFLCSKTLSLNKDVFMYKGDQGFCSVECRSRQMYLDEVKDMERSIKQTLASFRRCGGETKNLLEEFRQPRSGQKGRNGAPIFTFS